MASFELKEIERRMRGALGVLKQEFGGLRTGRASTSLLDPITVLAYGNPMPLNQLATINVPEPRLITVQVWDRSQVGAVERAITPLLDAGAITIKTCPTGETKAKYCAYIVKCKVPKVIDMNVPAMITPQLVMMPPVRTTATRRPSTRPRRRCSSSTRVMR